MTLTSVLHDLSIGDLVAITLKTKSVIQYCREHYNLEEGDVGMVMSFSNDYHQDDLRDVFVLVKGQELLFGLNQLRKIENI